MCVRFLLYSSYDVGCVDATADEALVQATALNCSGCGGHCFLGRSGMARPPLLTGPAVLLWGQALSLLLHGCSVRVCWLSRGSPSCIPTALSWRIAAPGRPRVGGTAPLFVFLRGCLAPLHYAHPSPAQPFRPLQHQHMHMSHMHTHVPRYAAACHLPGRCAPALACLDS
jgi:hypothetical protein